MTKILPKLYLLLYCWTNLLNGQELDLKNFDYSRSDSIAIHFPKKKYKGITEITYPLTEHLDTEHEKFRAIFRWITENIEYNKSAGSISEGDKIIRKNKAVCQGFSNLLKEMCATVNIPCEVVVGYTKTETKDINRKLKKTDHAWNTVRLYGKEYLVDVTWATSKYNVIARRFIKEFDEHYFLTPPEKFGLDHFPKEKKYQLVPKPIKARQFIRTPVYYPDYFHLDIKSINPNTGKFTHHAGKPLRFEVACDRALNSAGILINADKYILPLEIKKTANPGAYTFDYTFDKPGRYDITIYVNNNCIAEYLLEVK